MNLLGAAADEEGHSFWSIGRMSAAVEVSTKTVGKILGELEGRGLLRRKRRVRENGQFGVYDVWLIWPAIFALPLTPWQSKRATFKESPEEPSVPVVNGEPEEPRVLMADAPQSSDGHENPGFRAEHLEENIQREPQLNDGALFASSTDRANGKTSARKTRSTPIGDHFIVTPEMRAWANAEVPTADIDRETAQFVDYWKAKGGTKADWIAAWRTWMRNGAKYAKERAGPASGLRKAAMGEGEIRTRTVEL